MRRGLISVLFILLFFSGCASVSSTKQEQPAKQEESRIFTKEFSLEQNINPELKDQTQNYITKEFTNINGVIWNPIRFLDNDHFLYVASSLDYTDPWVCLYDFKTKKTQKLYPSEGGYKNLFIQNENNYSLTDNSALVSISQNQVSNKILFRDWKEKYQKYEAYDVIANPNNGKLVLVDKNSKNCILTDLELENVKDLPFDGVYSACWIDNDNIIFGAFDNIQERKGSAVVIYNIQSEKTTKTYIDDTRVFVDPGRDSDEYCGFAYLDDYHGPPGAFGIVNYEKEKINFLNFKNIADMNFQYHWLITAVADQTIDWEAWGSTLDGIVSLCVYDIDRNSYEIRDNAIPRPAGMIISPDGKTIIYKTFNKAFINVEK